MFITDAELQQAFADLQALPGVGDLQPRDLSTIITHGNAAAYGSIVRALVKRGFSKTQVDQWVDGAEFQRDIALYFCILKSNGLNPIPPEQMTTWKALDRRAELATVEVLNSSYALIVPAGTRIVVGGGAIDTGNDLVRLDDDATPDDRRGTVTEW